ncbi:U4/U6 small nuclear ribonucleoprotein Prp31 [Seminavis robusta]|uniref:U4/U6 small nuclear ribonucleoprotein Prp31 n=1 Tax=Seminavis robusta TaxID=568900 RepID=A0A9N8EKF6_9STRA|nr:U4/U6 small nuclear ribonucleoprotein Prp31 [Seminavis robusta]|eukprot:Sro1295_g260220.1 U4/U6 small nuclear ribonucleoprotein Prp31 (499) ;mRNA; f:5486-7239
MEGGATLADSLLDDLDDLSDGDDPEEEESKPAAKDDDDMNVEEKTAISMPQRKRLLDSPSLQQHLKVIQKSQLLLPSSTKDERDDEHQLIVTSNKFLASLLEELAKAHGVVCDIYKPKFSELEELLPNFIQYKNAVRVIWNEMDIAKVQEALIDVLNSNQIITLSVAGSTTSGRPLTDDELQQLEEAVVYMEDILQTQQQLTQFVESRMESLAPSVCALVGPSTAAKLIGLAGGLAELSKIPSCNLQVLGQVKHNSASRAGLSSLSTRPHQGVLAECDMVQRCPKAMQKKVLKTVAAKLALVARCDFVNVDAGRTRSAAAGKKFREEIETKINQWGEPDKAPVLKALPKPDLTIKKRRGGKRMRRLKERYEETAMMKQANTRAFGAMAGEYGDDSMGKSMGLLDTAEATGVGSIRKTTEKRKMRQANTKNSRKRQAQMSAIAAQGKGGTSGMASSMTFSTVQGMELVNPDANKERVREANKKWFSDHAGFQSALPKRK